MILANRFYPRRGCYYKSLLFYVQKMNTLMFPAREKCKPAFTLPPEESDELVCIQKMLNVFLYLTNSIPPKTSICELGTLQIFFFLTQHLLILKRIASVKIYLTFERNLSDILQVAYFIQRYAFSPFSKVQVQCSLTDR